MDYININKNDLDGEFVMQSGLMLSYSEQLAELNKDVSDYKDRIKYEEEELKTLQSGIDLKVRTGEIKIDVKITENAIKSVIETNKEVVSKQDRIFKMRKKYNELIRDRDIMNGVVEALRHKKVALENLVTLYQLGYFSTPKQGSNNSKRLKIRDDK